VLTNKHWASIEWVLSGWPRPEALPDGDVVTVAGESGVNLEVWLAKRSADPGLFAQGAL